jgi:hypothetical protein
VGLYPLAFVRSGRLLVTRRGTIVVVSPDGSALRRYRYRGKNGFAFDQRTESLFFVTPKRVLVRAKETQLRVVRPLGDLDGWIYFAGRDLLVFHDDHEVAVTRRNGRLVARASWSDSQDWVLDSGLTASGDRSTYSFRLTMATARSREGTAVLHVLRAGEKEAQVIHRHRLGESGCAVGASLTWHGRFLLYSSTDGHVAAFDSRDGSGQTLTELAAALPHRVPGEHVSAYWASDFPD